MTWLQNFLTGKKTYLAAAGFVLIAVYHIASGNGPAAVENIMAALALFGLRQAIAVK